MKQRIVWTTRENDLVLIETARMIGVSGHPTVSIINKAQSKVLPKDRQKSLSGLNGMLYRKGDDTFKGMLKRVKLPREPEQIQTTIPVEAPTPVTEEPEMTIDQMIDQLSDAFRLRLRSALQRVTREELERVTGEETFNLAAGMLKEKKKLPRVLVVGPKPDQQELLKSEFDGVLALSFSEGDNPSRAAKSAENVGAVIVWGNFISHSTIHSIEKVAKDRMITVKGGMNTLSDTLMKLAVV